VCISWFPIYIACPYVTWGMPSHLTVRSVKRIKLLTVWTKLPVCIPFVGLRPCPLFCSAGTTWGLYVKRESCCYSCEGGGGAWSESRSTVAARTGLERVVASKCSICFSPISRSWSYITTDSQSARLSWCQAPIWDLWPIFLSPWNFLQTVACLLFYTALSDERTGL
jgi:hypothetical protein